MTAPDWSQSHYRFLIRTFWIYLGLVVLFAGLLVALILTGAVLAGLGALATALWLFVWWYVRCWRGKKFAAQQKPIPNPASWLFGG
jgi:uncharacterized membrane protein